MALIAQALVTNLAWAPLGMPKSWRWPCITGASDAQGPGLAVTRADNTAGQLTDSSGQITDTVYGEDEMAPGLASYPLGHYRPTNHEKPTTIAEYIWLPTANGPLPVAVQIAERLYAIHSDHLNTPRRLTDQNGHPA